MLIHGDYSEDEFEGPALVCGYPKQGERCSCGCRLVSSGDQLSCASKKCKTNQKKINRKKPG